MAKLLKAYTNFNKGSNNSASPETLVPEELLFGENIDLQITGGYSQRKGCQKAIQNPLGESPVYRLINYPGKPLAVVGTTLMDWQGNVIKAGLATGEIDWQFFTNKKLYFGDGTKYYVYDGTTCAEVTPATGADLTNVKKCKLFIQRGQRMFTLGDGTNYVYFSATGEPNNFTASQAVNALSDDVFTPVAAEVYGQALVIFKRHDVYAWSGWDPTTDVRFDSISAHDGTVSPLSVCKAGNYLMYLGDDAIIAVTSLSTDQLSTMRVSPGVTELIKDLTNRDKAVGIYYRGNYYLACCNDGTGVNNLVLKCHVSMEYPAFESENGYQRIMPFTWYKGWAVASWFIDDNEDLYFGSYNGMIYKAFQGDTDDGTAIVAKVSHRVNLSDSFRLKKLKSLLLLAQQAEGKACTIKLELILGSLIKHLEVELDYNGQWDVSEWDNSFWDWSDLAKCEISIPYKVDRFQLTLTHDVSNEPFTLYGFGVVFKPKQPKGVRSGVHDTETV